MDLFVILGAGAVGFLATLGYLLITRRFGREEDPLDPEISASLIYSPPGTVVDGIVEDRTVHSTPERPIGYRILHKKARNQCVVVPVMSRPLAQPYQCPTCHTAHVVKSIHLWVDADGHTIVSKGVLEDLRLAGLEANHILYEGAVSKPPPLRAGHGINRAEIDHHNRKIVHYKVV